MSSEVSESAKRKRETTDEKIPEETSIEQVTESHNCSADNT